MLHERCVKKCFWKTWKWTNVCIWGSPLHRKFLRNLRENGNWPNLVCCTCTHCECIVRSYVLQLCEPSNALCHNFPPFFWLHRSVVRIHYQLKTILHVKVWEVYVIWKRLIKVLSMCKLMGSDYSEKKHGFLSKVWQKNSYIYALRIYDELYGD